MPVSFKLVHNDIDGLLVQPAYALLTVVHDKKNCEI